MSQEDYKLITTIVQSLQTHPISEDLFNFDEFNKEIFYQFPIYFEYEGVEMKALLDIVIIDHINKEVSIYDIKTIGDEVINFYKSYSRNRYDIQAVTYSEAMRYYLDKNGMFNYKIKPFSFVVESTVNPGNPCIFTMDAQAYTVAYEGLSRHFISTSDYTGVEPSYITKNPYKGFKQLIDDYKWYVENGFSVDRRIVENKNYFDIHLDYID